MKRPACLVAFLLLGGCGGGSEPSAPPAPPPPPPPPPATVASVAVSSPFTSVLAGSSISLVAVARDGSGNVLSGRTTSWSSSPAAIAAVNSAGLMTALAPGAATITATVEGVSGVAAVTVVDPRNIPFFEKPFTADWEVGNLLDHNIPKEFVDNNGIFTSFWGEAHPETGGMTDGHSGYDFRMPTGTPLLAVAAGTVKRVDLSSVSFFCPPLNRNVNDQMSVFIEHNLPGNVTVQSWYVHLSRIDVTVGQVVTSGQVIGLNGNTGCSTDPHLHFEVFRVVAGGALRTLDPYGWTGAGADPWESHVDGTASIQLWKAGKAPLLQRELNFVLTAAPFAPLVLTKVAYEGIDDTVNPNNEYAELTLDTRLAATLSLNGYGLRPHNQASLAYSFPSGLTLTAAQPKVRVYTGAGTNSGLTLYMGKPSGIWGNNRTKVCAVVTYPVGQSGAYFNPTCP